jgi:hypothetical protein
MNMSQNRMIVCDIVSNIESKPNARRNWTYNLQEADLLQDFTLIPRRRYRMWLSAVGEVETSKQDTAKKTIDEQGLVSDDRKLYMISVKLKEHKCTRTIGILIGTAKFLSKIKK